jgi:hypothetical protein
MDDLERRRQRIGGVIFILLVGFMVGWAAGYAVGAKEVRPVIVGIGER